MENESGKKYSYEDIASVMPHQNPFLFLDGAVIFDNHATATYTIKGDEFFLKGHFKDNPVFPASIMLEALGQLAVLFLLVGKHPDLARNADPSKIFFTSTDGVRCSRICKPGDVLNMIITPKRLRHPAGLFEGKITCENAPVAFAEKISLTFDYKHE